MRRWPGSLILTAAFLLLVSVPGFAQVVNLGKPTPSAQNLIAVDVQPTLGALPATAATCSAPAVSGTGPYRVQFTASPDHAVIEHTVAKVTRYEFVITPPTTSQPCYLGLVRSVGPGGTTASASAPFPLAVGAPAAPGSSPVITRSTGGL